MEQPASGDELGLEWHTPEGGLVIDVRFAPIVVCTWYGANTYDKIDRYFEWSEAFLAEALRRRTRVVFVSDVLDSARADAKVRRYVADKMEAHRTDAYDALIMANFVAVRSALVRGAMTAITWFSSRPTNMVPVEDMPTAFEHALRALQAHGQAPPASLDVAAYRRPVPPSFRDGES